MKLDANLTTRLQSIARRAHETGSPVDDTVLEALAQKHQVDVPQLKATLLGQLRALDSGVAGNESAGANSTKLRGALGTGGLFKGQSRTNLRTSPALQGTNLKLPTTVDNAVPERIGNAPAPESRIGQVGVAWAALTQIPGLDLAGAQVNPLKGGATNDLYKVALPTEGKTFVLRLAGEGNAHIDRDRDVAATLRAAEQKLGPDVRYVSDDKKTLLIEFIDVAPITKDNLLASKSGFHDVARALKAVHDGPPFEDRQTFNPFQRIRESADLVTQKGLMSVELKGALTHLEDLESRLSPFYTGSTTPCHNDTNPGNILLDKDKAHLIDWDYAGNGDPVYDLGTLAVCLGLGDKDQTKLMAEYLGCAPKEVPPEKEAHLEMSRLTNTLWAALSFASKSETPGDLPAVISQANLEDFQSRVSGGAFARHLEMMPSVH